MKVVELIDKVNILKGYYTLSDIEEYLNIQSISENINLFNYTTYGICTNIYECEDGYVGIRGIFYKFPETTMNIFPLAFEVEKINTISYKEKQK